MSLSVVLGALSAIAVASGATAGITDMDWTPISVNALDLAPDGVWSQGDDYEYREYEVAMFETWVGGFGRHVMFDIAYAHDGARGGTGINFNKSLTNNTNFFWSSFQIVLTPALGSTISNVAASSNAAFSDVDVSPGGGGSWVILWDQDMGTGVSTGDGAAFSFGFDITGNLGFTMKQTPLPTPAGAALLGVAGLWGVRRRRA